MSKSFVNNYWSSDYKSGISKLSQQSCKSLKQLNDLSALLNHYITYYNSNSNDLNKIGIDSFQIDNGFRENDSLEEDTDMLAVNLNDRIHKRISSTLLSFQESINSLDLNNTAPIYEKEIKADQLQILSNDKSGSDFKHAQSLLSMFEKHIENTSEESYNLFNLSTVLEKSIKYEVDEFLKINEQTITEKLNNFKQLLKNYEIFHNKVEKLKIEYFELLRLQEIYDNDKNTQIKTSPPNIKEPASGENEKPAEPNSYETPKKNIIQSPVKFSSPKSVIKNTGELDFEFPLKIGYSQFTSSQLVDLLKHMIAEIPTAKRKFQLPGYSSDIFQSEHLSNWLTKNRPKTENSRLQIEKFGQNLIDLKFITGTNFLLKKFKSAEMWFEWSELARFVATYNEGSIDGENEEIPLTDEKSSEKVEEFKFKNIPTVVIEESPRAIKNASMKIGDVLNNLKSTVLKTNYTAQLEAIEPKYVESYFNLQEYKYLIEISIAESSSFFERFEKDKIKLIYNSLTKLAETLRTHSSISHERLGKLCTELIEGNNPQNYDLELTKVLDRFSTGIFFPSNMPINISKNSNTHHNNNNNNDSYQNLKLKFNLFNDMSLQLTLDSDSVNTKSLPLFFYGMIELLNDDGNNSLIGLWDAPLNQYEYWQIKEKIIELISEYEPNLSSINEEKIVFSEESNITNQNRKLINLVKSKEKIIHQEIVQEILKFLKSTNKSLILNFMKNWLLELTDSMLPFIIYDSVVRNCERHETRNSIDKGLRRKELIKIISTIPRNNLSSLVFLLEHIISIFSLQNLEGYYYKKNEPEVIDIDADDDEESEIPDYVKQLNSMDTIGGVPFIHLILRPSKLKHSNGFKPDLKVYNIFLADLLDYDVRKSLLEELTNKENSFILKKEQELNNIKLQVKKFPPTTPKVTNKRLSGTRFGNTPINADGIQLRPFRTGTTPNPSPGNSPVHTPKVMSSRSRTNSVSSTPNIDSMSIDGQMPFLNIGKNRQSQDYGAKTRNRSSSFMLAPPINVEYE